MPVEIEYKLLWQFKIGKGQIRLDRSRGKKKGVFDVFIYRSFSFCCAGEYKMYIQRGDRDKERGLDRDRDDKGKDGK